MSWSLRTKTQDEGHLVRTGVVLGSFQLNLEPLGANLKSMHVGNGGLCTERIVVGDKTCEKRETGVQISELEAWNLFFLSSETIFILLYIEYL